MKKRIINLILVLCLIINFTYINSDAGFSATPSITSDDGMYKFSKILTSSELKYAKFATTIDHDNVFFLGTGSVLHGRMNAYIYNISSNTFKKVASPPLWNDGDWRHGKPSHFFYFEGISSLKDGRVLVVGRYHMQIYDPATNKWEQRKNEMPVQRGLQKGNFYTAGLENGNVAIFAGGQSGDYNPNTYIYNPSIRTFSIYSRWNEVHTFSGNATSLDANNVLITDYLIRHRRMNKALVVNVINGSGYSVEGVGTSDYDFYYGAKTLEDIILFKIIGWDKFRLGNFYVLEDKRIKPIFEQEKFSNFAQANILDSDPDGWAKIFPVGIGNKVVIIENGQIMILQKMSPPQIDNFNAPDLVHIGEQANLTWNASDQDGDSLKYTLYIGNSKGANEYLIADTTANSYKFNVPDNIPLSWNSYTGRFERQIYARLIASDGQKEVQKDCYFTAVNYKPNVIGYASGSKVSYGNNFTISGKAWDINSDKLTVECTIDGKKKTTTLNSSPSSQPSGNNYSFTWNDLTPGTYENIKVRVTDVYRKYQEIVIGKVTVKDPLGDLNNKLDKVPKKSNELLFVAANTETAISQTTRSNNLINSIKSKLSNRVAEELFLVGESGSTKSYLQSKLTTNYVTTTEDKVTELADYIANIVQAKSSTTFLSGDILEYNMLFEDIEKDYQNISVSNKLKSNGSLSDLLKKWKDGTLQIKYSHNPSVFDNPVSRHSKGNDAWKTISNIDDSWVIKNADSSMRGQWTMTIKASDTTKNSGFDKFTDDVTVNFIIHEKPKAIIEYNDDGTYLSLSGESSYDSDFQYKLIDNGITKYEWYYLIDGNWQKWSEENQRVKIPRFMGGKEVKGYYLTVTDSYGATDTTQEKNVISYKLQSILGVEDNRFSTNSIPASENIKVTDIKTIPAPTDTINFALYKSSTRKTDIKTLSKNSDVVSSEVLVANWKDIRNYRIPETLPDGSYTAKVTAIKGSTVLTNNHNLVVNTPINLMPAMPSLFYVGEKIKIVATTSKYADSVTVDVFSDGNSENMNYIKQENDIKYWELDYTVPLNTDGGHIATFNATTPNGNIESTTLNFVLVALTVTGEVNHTTKWNENRIKYNVAKTGDTDNPRTYDVFFPGEKFMLKASTNVGANADRVDVEIIGTPYSTPLVNTSGDTWEGSIWHEDMLNWSDRTLNFKFKAYKNGIERVDNVTVKIVDDEYWRLHRKF